MEPIMWLIIWIRAQLWEHVNQQPPEIMTPRTQATLDLIHVLNEITSWAERSHYGDSGEILPVATMERQAFYDVLRASVAGSMTVLRDWDKFNTDDIRKAMHAHIIGLDTVATMCLQPYYSSCMFELANLIQKDSEGTSDGTHARSTIQDDDGQRGNDSTGN